MCNFALGADSPKSAKNKHFCGFWFLFLGDGCTAFYLEPFGKDVITMGFFKKLFGKAPEGVFAPLSGKAVPISEVPDPTFAEGLLGNGIAILPVDGKVVAPCDGIIGTMFDTGHAVTLVAQNGAEILIHVGLETVSLSGKPFTVHVKDGDKVKKGQVLMEADLDAIKAAGLPIITPVVICNSDEFTKFETHVGGDVTNDDLIIDLGK
jgi:PTS system beta-glucosides-specific IIC component